jgi:hypothetical protein
MIRVAEFSWDRKVAGSSSARCIDECPHFSVCPVWIGNFSWTDCPTEKF